MDIQLQNFCDEINKYSEGIHFLNNGIKYEEILVFENKYNIILPNTLKKFLQQYNGGELFAGPAGIMIAGILNSDMRKEGIPYLEDNFIINKRVGIPPSMFMLADLNDGEIVGLDLKKSSVEEGYVIQWDPELALIVNEWSTLYEWLDYVMKEGHSIFDYCGNEII